MAPSPLEAVDGALGILVSSQGQPLGDDARLLSIETRHEINQLPSARLVFADGDMPNGEFPLSDQPTLAPGAEILVEAGYTIGREQIFKGVVVGHRVKMGADGGAQLVIHCLDPAFRMGTERRSAVHPGLCDSQLLAALINRAGLTAEVPPDGAEVADRVQVDCSDWDFLVARAQAHGWAVLAQAGTVAVAPPDTAAAAVLQVHWGTDLMACEVELDSSPGWAGHRGLKRVRGQLRFAGHAAARVGTMLELQGVGNRFSGPVWVHSVVHALQDGEWVTEVGFGPPPPVPVGVPVVVPVGVPVAAPAAVPSPLDARIQGLHVGRIVGHSGDPTGAHRLQVQVPGLGPAAAPLWARLLQFQASDGAGAWFVPAAGDEVVLGFFHNDPVQPVILGSLYSAQHEPPGQLADGGHTQGIVTRGGLRLVFNDDDKSITVTTPADHQIVLSDRDRSIVLQDNNGNHVTLNPQGVAIQTAKDLHAQAQGTITLEATGGVHIASPSGAVQLSGLEVSCQARIGFKATGQATAELSAAGQTVVRGGLVMIN